MVSIFVRGVSIYPQHQFQRLLSERFLTTLVQNYYKFQILIELLKTIEKEWK